MPDSDIRPEICGLYQELKCGTGIACPAFLSALTQIWTVPQIHYTDAQTRHYRQRPDQSRGSSACLNNRSSISTYSLNCCLPNSVRVQVVCGFLFTKAFLTAM